MSDVNIVVVTGRLARDVELKTINGGTTVANLSLAVNKIWYDKSGEKREEVAFVDVSVFGKQAENAGQYLSKGSKVCITGSLKEDRWEDRETGKKRSRLKVTADALNYLEFNRGGWNQSSGEQDSGDVPY